MLLRDIANELAESNRLNRIFINRKILDNIAGVDKMEEDEA